MNEHTPIEITEAASDWLDRLAGSDLAVADRQAFAGWLQRSPVHVAEFLQVSALHAELSGALAGHPDWAQALIDQAVDQVITLPERPFAAETDGAANVGCNERATKSHLHIARWLAGAAVLAMTAVGTFWGLRSEGVRTIVTEIGEQRVIVLADGSTLELNTDSKVHVHMSDASRAIELERGELLVDVASDPERIFRVRTDDAVIEAIGTRFNVYRRNEATDVTVVEGRVAVEWPTTQGGKQSPARMQSRKLKAGLRLTVTPSVLETTPITANLEEAIAWTERRLMFTEETVQAVASEFNRYNRNNIIISDPNLAKRRITGVFNVNDPGAFMMLLGGLDAIEVQVTEGGDRRLSGKNATDQ